MGKERFKGKIEKFPKPKKRGGHSKRSFPGKGLVCPKKRSKPAATKQIPPGDVGGGKRKYRKNMFSKT